MGQGWAVSRPNIQQAQRDVGGGRRSCNFEMKGARRHVGPRRLEIFDTVLTHPPPPPATMRGAVFLAIIALCALADETSAVARAGGAGTRAGKKSRGSGRSSNGSNTGGDRDRPGKITAAARRKRDKTAPSHDGARTNGRDPSAVVIGAVREERGHQVKMNTATAVGKIMTFLVRGATNGQKSCARGPNAGAPPGWHQALSLQLVSISMYECTVVSWCWESR